MTKYEFPATPMFGDETNTWIPRGSGSDRDFLSYKTLTIHEAASLYYGIHPGRLNEILWENGTMWHSLFYNTVNQLCRAVMSGEIRTPDKNIQTLGDVSEHTSMLTDSVLSYFAKERINGEGKPSEKTFLNDIYISTNLSILNRAAVEFWSKVEKDNKATHPDQTKIVDWLKKKGFSDVSAKQGAVIIRPDWANSGRPPKKVV
jgi:hypothetical protein